MAAPIAALFIRLPYDTIAPGSSRQVNDVILVKDGPSYPPKGEILETTVSVRERVSPYEVLYGWLSPDIDVIAEKQVRGNVPPKVYAQQDFCTDVRRPGMVHGRMIRPAIAGAVPVKVDESSINDIPGATSNVATRRS